MEVDTNSSRFTFKKPVYAEVQGETGEANESGPVCLWRLPQSLSQSRLGGRKRRSYACTIIGVRMAQRLASLQLPALPHVKGLRDARPLKRKCPSHPPPDFLDLLQKRARKSDDDKDSSEDSEPAQPMDDGTDPASVPNNGKENRCTGSLKTVCPIKRRIRRVFGLESRSSNTKTSGYSSSSDENMSSGGVEPPRHLLDVLIRAIQDGNSLHADAMRCMKRSPSDSNFNVPHAIQAAGGGIRELDWVVITGCFRRELERQLSEAVTRWATVMGQGQASPLMTVLVISRERTVLFVYQPCPALLALFDSHSHGSDGAFIALCPAARLSSFCQWIYDVIFPDMPRVAEESQSFEVSLIMATPPGVTSNHPALNAVAQQLHNSVFIKPPRRSARIAAASKSHSMIKQALNMCNLEAYAGQGKGGGRRGLDQSFFDQPLIHSSESSSGSSCWSGSPHSMSSPQSHGSGPWPSASSPALLENYGEGGSQASLLEHMDLVRSPLINTKGYLSHGGCDDAFRQSLGGGGGAPPIRRSPRHRPLPPNFPSHSSQPHFFPHGMHQGFTTIDPRYGNHIPPHVSETAEGGYGPNYGGYEQYPHGQPHFEHRF